MLDLFLILTPLLVLAVVALLGFVGCASFSAAETPPAPTTPTLATNTTVSASATTANAGDKITFTAKVSATASDGTPVVPSGLVDLKEVPATLGTKSIDSTGATSFDVTTLLPGSHNLTADYAGNSSFYPSLSSPVTVTINAAPSTLPVAHVVTLTNNAPGGTNLSVSLPPLTAPGKLVIAVVQWGGAANATLTGAAFTRISNSFLNPQQLSVYYANNITGSITVTATLSAVSSTEFNLIVSAYDHADLVAAPDQTGNAQGTGTAATLSMPTVGLTAGDLVYAVAVSRSSGLVLSGALSAGATPAFTAEAGQGSYLLVEDRVLQSPDLAAPQINITATNTTGTATSHWYLFAMHIKHG
jgi:Bacterial Ig-like domain (group 3)